MSRLVNQALRVLRDAGFAARPCAGGWYVQRDGRPVGTYRTDSLANLARSEERRMRAARRRSEGAR